MWRIPWFRRDAKGEDQNHGKTLGKRELGKDTKANSGDLSSRLSQICGGKTALSAGRVHILSFAGLPERFGKKWSAIEDRVAQLILRILDAHLSKNDLHYELAPRFHALVFADISPEIAALKCAVIAREVMTRLFGDEPFDDCLSIETAQLDKDGNLETNRIDPKLVVIQALESLLPIIEPRVTDTKSSIDDNNPGGDGPATETALSNNHQPVHPPQLQPILERPIRRAPDPNDLDYQEALYSMSRLLGDTSREIIDWQRILPIQAKSQIQHVSSNQTNAMPASAAARQGPPPRPIRKIVAGTDNITVRYLPIWYVEKEYVTTYQARLLFQGNHPDMSIDDILGDDDAVELELNADLLMVRRGLSDLAQQTVVGKRVILSLTLHARTLTDRASRGRLFSLLDQAPDQLRRFMVAHVIRIEKGDPIGLPSGVDQLQSRIRAVNLTVPISGPFSKAILACKAYSVGCDLRETNLTEVQVLRLLPEFAKRAKEANFFSFAIGLDTKSLVLGAVFAGFDFIGGNSVIPETNILGDIQPFQAIDLYKTQ